VANDKEANKQRILDFFAAAAEGGDIMAFLSDDLEWWLPDSFPLGGTYKKAELAAVLGPIFGMLKAPPQFTINHITAEDDRVAVDCQSTAEMNDGSPFGNTYHFLFILKDNLIVCVKEFLNTAYISKVLAEQEAKRA